MRRLLLLVALALTPSVADAAVVCTNLVASSSGGGTSKATASISPTANNLVIAWVKTGSAAGNTMTASGAGMTWVEIGTYFYNSSIGRITAFRAMSASPGSGAVTFTASASQTSWFWSIEQCSGVDTSGTNGSGAIAANANSLTANTGAEVTTAQTASSITVTLAALSNANNATLGYFSKSGNVFSAGSGYTALSGSGGTTLSEYKAPGSTTVNATYSSQTSVSVGGAAIEVKSSAVAAVNGPRGPLVGLW